MKTETQNTDPIPVIEVMFYRSLQFIRENPELPQQEVFDKLVASCFEPYDEALALQWYGEHKDSSEWIKRFQDQDMISRLQGFQKKFPEYDDIMILYSLAWHMGFEAVWELFHEETDGE